MSSGRRFAAAVVGAVTLAVAVFLVAACGGSDDREFRVASSSMEPTLHCAEPGIGCETEAADRITVEPVEGDVARGDIVVFETPPAVVVECGIGGNWPGRVIGLGGETIAIREGVVYIDGQELPEPYLADDRRGGSWSDIGETAVPDGHLFVLGDNRSRACDSSIWGAVPSTNVIGVVTDIEVGAGGPQPTPVESDEPVGDDQEFGKEDVPVGDDQEFGKEDVERLLDTQVTRDLLKRLEDADVVGALSTEIEEPFQCVADGEAWRCFGSVRATADLVFSSDESEVVPFVLRLVCEETNCIWSEG